LIIKISVGSRVYLCLVGLKRAVYCVDREIRAVEVSYNIHKCMFRYIVPYAVWKNPCSQLCLANKRGTQGLDLSVCLCNTS